MVSGCYVEVCSDGTEKGDRVCPELGNVLPPGETDRDMSFFVTSRPIEVAGQPVTGGDFGGLEGADAFCAQLAEDAIPANGRTWRAFLSDTMTDARDRIGTGPWVNASGQTIATDVDTLFANPPTANLIRDENGRAWNGGVSQRHDVITGSNRDGRRFTQLDEMLMGHSNPEGSLFSFPDGSFAYEVPVFDFSCNNYSTNNGGAMSQNFTVVGHLDWSELPEGTGSDDWITSHVTACDQSEMNLSGGDIRIYCFALD